MGMWIKGNEALDRQILTKKQNRAKGLQCILIPIFKNIIITSICLLLDYILHTRDTRKNTIAVVEFMMDLLQSIVRNDFWEFIFRQWFSTSFFHILTLEWGFHWLDSHLLYIQQLFLRGGGEPSFCTAVSFWWRRCWDGNKSTSGYQKNINGVLSQILSWSQGRSPSPCV